MRTQAPARRRSVCQAAGVGAAVTVVGSINVDVVVRVPRLPDPGETVTGSSVERLPGGKGANQAAALARLGVSTALASAVGDDPDGALSLTALDGVDVTAVRTVDAPTGLAFITVEENGENTIVVVSGANRYVQPPRSCRALVVQLEIPMDVVAASVAAADGLVVLNAAPATTLPADLLGGVDVLVVNESEALVVADRATVTEALTALVPRVRGGVVVTLGAAGCLVATGSDRVAVPSPSVTAVDSVGAGDAFVAALTWQLLVGATLVDAAAVACTAGALSVTRHGARSSPTRAELDASTRA